MTKPWSELGFPPHPSPHENAVRMTTTALSLQSDSPRAWRVAEGFHNPRTHHGITLFIRALNCGCSAIEQKLTELHAAPPRPFKSTNLHQNSNDRSYIHKREFTFDTVTTVTHHKIVDSTNLRWSVGAERAQAIYCNLTIQFPNIRQPRGKRDLLYCRPKSAVASP